MLENSGQSDQLFVAKAFAMTRQDGESYTYTTWTEGVRTLLPAADVVLLVEQPASADEAPQMTWIRWDVVAEVCADECWKVMPEFDPPRILTAEWPTPSHLSMLMDRALTRS